jgi:Leucine-rich repeat (LRR) protein
MKKVVVLFLLMFCACSNGDGTFDLDFSNAGISFGGVLPYVFVSDSNFEQALIDLGYDDVLDGQVDRVNIENVTSLDISNKNIRDLGLYGFEALEVLNCSNNELTEINVTSNSALTNLNINNNQITVLDLSLNRNLINITCSDNQITSINITGCSDLESLDCRNNAISSIIVSLNARLKAFNCSNNLLRILTLSNNPDLERVACTNNRLESLFISSNNNSSLVYMNALNNPDLECIEIDFGFIPPDCGLPQEELGWCKEDWTSYSNNCN